MHIRIRRKTRKRKRRQDNSVTPREVEGKEKEVEGKEKEKVTGCHRLPVHTLFFFLSPPVFYKSSGK